MQSDASRSALAVCLTLFASLLTISNPASAHIAGAGSARATYDFNSGWRLVVGDPKGAEQVDFDDASWKPVTLPHA